MPKCILIVDDSPLIRNLIRTYFDVETDFEICGEAVDGADAIEKAEQLKPDLIILDASMPRMNGLEAARILRSMDREVPIILFTLHADMISSSEAVETGITAVVSKMDKISELSRQVEGLLNHV